MAFFQSSSSRWISSVLQIKIMQDSDLKNLLQNVSNTITLSGGLNREMTVMRISSTLCSGTQPSSQAYALCDITQVMTVIKTFSSAGAMRDIPGPILQFTSCACSWRCAAGREERICLPTDPPLSWAHQANWSGMWGSGVTASCAPLYGSSSFYTFCCITVQDNQHKHWVSKQQAFHSVTLTSTLTPQLLSRVQPTTLRLV